MTNNVNRIKLNMERIRAATATNATEIRLQLCDDELKLVSMNPSKCRPSGIWREGREFHLFTHAKATWAGSGWWDIKAPNRTALQKVLARLSGKWFPPPVQKTLPLPPPERKLTSKEEVAKHMARCREILAGR